MSMTIVTLWCLSAGLIDGIEVPRGEPIVRMEPDGAGGVSFLSWDTEGGSRAGMNLLYAPVRLELLISGTWTPASDLSTETTPRGGKDILYRFQAGAEASTVWAIAQTGSRITFLITTDKPETAHINAVRMVFPFDPKATATDVLPSEWLEGAHMRLPAIVNAPDLGPMLLTANPDAGARGQLNGSREGRHTVDFLLEWPAADGKTVQLVLEPASVPQPEGFSDAEAWRAIRRGWLNMLQPSARWGSPQRPQSAPPGLLANNVVSDPVSCLLSMKGDHCLLAPHLAAGVDATPLLRNTLDWWFDHGVEPNGEMRSWRQVRGMLDANASPLIAAWCYVEASGDRDWLLRRVETIEVLADYLAGRDIDGDGLVESVYSGNYGTQIGRLGGSAYDTFNSGFKDGYGNALTYRAWRCVSDLESQLGRGDQSKRYAELADRLKSAYETVFYNPKTGWLAWWLSEDGELHDLAASLNTSLAILYGLVDTARGKVMLDRLWQKIEAVGFTNFSIGIPLTLEPVRQGDYSLPRPGGRRSYGQPAREDGSDTFQQYLNGGCCVSDAYYFITALYMVGETEKADGILHAMLKRQVEGVFPNGGGFQNGVIDTFPLGAEFMDWKGSTCGYEGHLVYSFSFLQAVLLREPAMRARIFRPLMEKP